ncbi:MAG: EamA family transporter [Streptosporangiaceae bacterium]
MVILLGLAAAMLYGCGDFIGGMASRRVPVLTVLLLAESAGCVVALAAALVWPGPVGPFGPAWGVGAGLVGLAWGAGAGLAGGFGLIMFYTGLATGPMSVVAPVSGLVSTILPVAVALAEGERPGAGVYAGAMLCLVAIVLASSAGGDEGERPGRAGGLGRAGQTGRTGRALAYGVGAGVLFGLFFLLIRNAGQSGTLWPVASARVGELASVLVAMAVLRPAQRRRSPARSGGLPGGYGGWLLVAAAGAGTIDVVANICYVTAARTGMFGLAVVLASLYPGITVLLARAVLGERLRRVQQAGLALAAIGIVLVAS